MRWWLSAAGPASYSVMEAATVATSWLMVQRSAEVVVLRATLH
jgi:hypothetical protein